MDFVANIPPDLLTVVTKHIHQALDVSGEAKVIALDISKAFDKVWHLGLIHKPQAYSISGPFFEIISKIISFKMIRQGSS